MKLLLPFLFLFISFFSFGQNYNCLQFGPRRFFITDYGFVRGMRLDSVRAAGSDTIFYPYRADRIHDYVPGWTLPTETSAASWLGKNVVKKSDGTFIFDNRWDTVFIKTQAHTGDSWMFFNDTTHYYYKATVASEDTMSILGVLDSVKKIRISAYHSGVVNWGDPVNDFEFILSKNHGFAQIFDLYTFPYHYPNKVGYIDSSTGETYMIRYADFNLDVLLGNTSGCDLGCIYDALPDSANSIFHLFPFHNPTNAELYGRTISVGDVWETDFEAIPPTGDGNGRATLDSVTEVTGSDYRGTEHVKSSHYHTSGPADCSYSIDSLHGSMAVITDSLLHSLPEENGSFLYYYPVDYPIEYARGGGCDSAPSYTFYYPRGWGYNDVAFIPAYKTDTYMPGFGLARSHEYTVFFYNITSELIFYNYGSGPCGGRVSLDSPVAVVDTTTHDTTILVSSVHVAAGIKITPNPTTDHISITSDQPFDNASISISDMTGRLIITEVFKSSLSVNTSNWPKGVYLVTLNGGNVIVRRERIIIE